MKKRLVSILFSLILLFFFVPKTKVCAADMARFDINPTVNGVYAYWGIKDLTFNLYINGSLVQEKVKDICLSYPIGTSYKIEIVSWPKGLKYLGANVPLEGVMTSSGFSVVPKFVTYDTFVADCIVDENNNLVTSDQVIKSNGKYKIVERTFTEATGTDKTFCLGKLKSKTRVSHSALYDVTLPDE